jgi:hypothetical protein
LDEVNFPDAMVATFCDALRTCCLMGEHPFAEATCESRMRRIVAGRTPTTSGARFVVKSAELCLRNLRSAVATCSAIQMEPCNQAYSGTAGLGEACESDDDCLDASGEPATCLAGACKIRLRGMLADSCLRTCLPDGTCVDFDQTGIDPDSPSVTRWADCFAVDGLICVEQTCQVAPGVGEACFQGSLCEKGLRCDEAGLCSAATSSDCGPCSSDAFCSEAHVCEGKRSEGAPCRADNYCRSELCLCRAEPCEGAPRYCSGVLTVGPVHGGKEECSGEIRF